MPVETRRFEAATKGRCDMLDVTSRVSDEVSRTGMSRGVATVFVPGSTCGVTTIEYESGALEDLRLFLNSLEGISQGFEDTGSMFTGVL